MGVRLKVGNKKGGKLKVVAGVMNEEQLLELADETWRKEATSRHRVPFRSERDRSLYLRLSRQCNDTVHSDLKTLKTQLEAATELYLYKTIDKIYLYTLYSYDFAYNYVAEAVFRSEYMEQISSHSKSLVEEAVAAAAAKDSTKMDKIANTAAWYRNMLQHYHETMQKPQDRSFINNMKRKDSTVDNLVKRYMNKLNFRRRFNSLAVVEKLQVWHEIIKESGKATFELTKDLKSLADVGATVLLITASLIVLDVLVSDHDAGDVLNNDMDALSSQFEGIDKYTVDAMRVVCLDKMLDRFGHLPAGVIFGDDAVKGSNRMTAMEAVGVAIDCSITTAAVIVFNAVKNGVSTAVTVASAGEEIPMVTLRPELFSLLGEEEEIAFEASFVGEEVASAGEGAALVGEVSETMAAIGVETLEAMETAALLEDAALVGAEIAAATGPVGAMVVVSVGVAALTLYVDYKFIMFINDFF